MAWLIKRGTTYYIRWSLAGKKRKLSTGTDNFQLAKDKLRRFEAAEARGDIGSALPTKTPIPGVLNAYIEHIRSAKTAKSAQTDIYYLRDVFGPVCEALKVTSRKLSPATKKKPPKPGQDRRRKAPVIEATHFEAITTAQISAFISGRMASRGLAPKTGTVDRKPDPSSQYNGRIPLAYLCWSHAMVSPMSDVTRLLSAASKGDAHASAELLPLVYQELRQLARAHMRKERSEHTLQATALVHEAYLRLFDDGKSNWDSRRHFFAAAAEAMRRILIEHARRYQALKNGGEHQRVELDDDLPLMALPCADPGDLLALDEALNLLSKEDPDKAELVKLLYFAGLNLDEAGAALGISRSAAHRHWVFAKTWLYNAIAGGANR